MENEVLVQGGVAILALLAGLPHVAAVLGKPKVVKALGILGKVFDVLAGNYGKAKNRDTTDKGAFS